MAKPARSDRPLRWVLLFLALAAVLAGLQVWNSITISDLVRSVETATGPATSKAQLEQETARQDLIAKQIENLTRGALPISLAAGLSTAVAALATILGAILALRGYLDAREKDRQDRLDASRKELAAREKDREDRLGAALNETLARLVSTEWRQRVVGAAGLLPFFTADRTDFHLQALTALIAAARIDDEQLAVRQSIRLAVERAIGTIAPEVLADVSWQGVVLRDADFTNARLAGLDLRDAVLENACFNGANLNGADLTAAKLQGAQLDGASLNDAVLSYADLAGASLAGAALSGAALSDAKVLNLDLDGADLRAIGAGWRGVPWDATRNWRKASFDPAVREELDRLYGPAAPDLHVLMLMWEFPPMVAGGTWTACYHLVRNLRRRGAQVTIVVPWSRRTLILDPPPFGLEVPVVTLDIEAPADSVAAGSSYGTASAPAPYAQSQGYGGGWSPYGGGWSPYGGGSALWSGYTARSTSGPSPYGGSYGVYGTGSIAGSVLFGLIKAFAERVRSYAADHPVDIIHAHDWVTFDAARAASERTGVPWVAHFHSTEAERQPDRTDPLTARIEQGAVDSATRLVTVSEATRSAIAAAYDPAKRRPIDVVPNCLSEEPVPTAEMGRFETHRVVFLGRLAQQKGVDRFCEVAEQVRKNGFTAEFVAYGDGPDRRMLWQHGIAAPGPLGWDHRGSAFRGASALLVPSRFEPFGMVILEAMQHRVPVIYPAEAGAAEVLQSGVKTAGDDTAAMATAVMDLLGDLGAWEAAATAAANEVESYPSRGYEDWLIAIWSEAAGKLAV